MLTLQLKKEWFEKIKSGEKTSEYRNYDYWYSRIFRKYDKARDENKKLLLRFTLGYPKQDDASREIFAFVKSIRILPTGINTDLKTPKPVIEINFEIIKCSGCRYFSNGFCLAYEASGICCADIEICNYKNIMNIKDNEVNK